MDEQARLLELEQRPPNHPESPPPVPLEQLQLRRPERRQVTFAAIEVDQLVAADHPVRAIWELTAQLDLRRFAAGLVTRRELAGRPAWDPRLLVAIWIWAYSQGIRSAREIERPSSYRAELQWLCGMDVVNHHSLSDFRVAHADALQEIFTQVLALLSQEGLVDLKQVAVDGTRVRSQAATSSERRRGTIERHLERARQAVKQLSADAADEQCNRRRQAARRRAAHEKVERMEQALAELQQVEAAKKSAKQRAQARVSSSEPEARRQHESNGGWASGYNAQLATDAKEKIVVGAALSNNASDAQQLQPTIADVEQRLQQKPRQVLADAGYNSRANIKAMQAGDIEYATPPPKPNKRSTGAARAAGIQPGFEAQFFIYDEVTDTFRCPAGKTLKYRRMSKKSDRTYRQYQGKESDCRHCERRLECCPKSGWRSLSRAEEDALLAQHRSWMETERARAA